MIRKFGSNGAKIIAMTMIGTLAACGSSADDPAEQIIVREQGAAQKTAEQSAPAAALDPVAAGKAAFAACSACHLVAAGAASEIGPNLHGVVGRKAASLADFGYSAAMKTSGITWTAAELDSFLANPAAKIPGTSMAAGAVADAQDRKAIIAYLTDISK